MNFIVYFVKGVILYWTVCGNVLAAIVAVKVIPLNTCHSRIEISDMEVTIPVRNW